MLTHYEATQTEGEVGPAVSAAIAGGILGGMGVIATNPNASFREVAIGVTGGAVGGGLGTIMRAGTMGAIAGGGIGLSAGGACSACHL